MNSQDVGCLLFFAIICIVASVVGAMIQSECGNNKNLYNLTRSWELYQEQKAHADLERKKLEKLLGEKE